jgi:glutamine synthetase
MSDVFKDWIAHHRIGEIECLVPDMNGVLRGKVLPATKFVQSEKDGSLRLPSSVFSVTVTGEYAGDGDEAYADRDLLLRPDAATLRVAPGFKKATAFVVADTFSADGQAWGASPRHVLKKVLALYDEKGWKPVVAPELEFYLTAINADPDIPLTPPIGRSGRAESAPQPYGLESITEYEDLVEAIYEHAAISELHLDTMIHESGAGQLEINFHHGDPLGLADQSVVFKRIVRQVALAHGVYATFMAKPMADEPGSAMHLHISIVDQTTGQNLFAGSDGNDTDLFRHFVGGLQKLLPEMAPLFAPTVNSFRRMRPSHSAPINVQWGKDNRSCGLRVPTSDAHNRRIENRLPGADANPYLAIASTLLAGYLGITRALKPEAQVEGNAYYYPRTLPKTLEEALERLSACHEVREILGESFMQAFLDIKQAELDHYQGVISSWERDHLLLKA